ncbi:hypothetical protein GHO38_26850 [Pseudomonas helleri]|nr:hypothetical protein [Pseudomonas helleri]
MASPEDIVLPILNTLSYTYTLTFKAFTKPPGLTLPVDLTFSLHLSYMKLSTVLDGR